MKTRMKKGFLFLTAVVVLPGIFVFPFLSAASTFPTKPITLIVPWPAGGSTDPAVVR